MAKTANSRRFTQTEAEHFVKKLVEDFFPSGDVKYLEDFYHTDVIGHYQDGTLNFSDIRNRVNALRNHVRDIHFTIEWCVAIDDLIVFTCRQTWVNKSDQKFHDTMVFGVYRMRAGKVAEVWLQLDTKTNPYQEINQLFTESMSPFETQQKNKRDFLRRLSRLPLAVDAREIKLSKQECESLFYYFNGFSSKEAGREMAISPRTFESYITHIKGYFDCRTKHELRKHIKL